MNRETDGDILVLLDGEGQSEYLSGEPAQFEIPKRQVDDASPGETNVVAHLGGGISLAWGFDG